MPFARTEMGGYVTTEGAWWSYLDQPRQKPTRGVTVLGYYHNGPWGWQRPPTLMALLWFPSVTKLLGWMRQRKGKQYVVAVTREPSALRVAMVRHRLGEHLEALEPEICCLPWDGVIPDHAIKLPYRCRKGGNPWTRKTKRGRSR